MTLIAKLPGDILQHPLTGVGKSEPLKENLQGMWSRRIPDEHLMACSVSNGMVYENVLSLRFHYSK